MNLWLPRLLGTCAICFPLALTGCGTWQAPTDVSDAALRNRAVTSERRNVSIEAAVLSAADTKRMLGANLDKAEVQPIWIEVRNGTSQPLWLLRSGTDPDYYSPLEVAWSLHTLLSGGMNAQIDQHFDKLGFKNPILPGETRWGLLFTNPQYRTKLLNVDLIGMRTLIAFTLFLPVPGDAADHGLTLFQYPNAQLTNYTDLTELRAALERLPCCATNASGTAQGDPLNVVFVGQLADIASAVVRRDYRRDNREVDRAQQLFGRLPDIELRKHEQGGAPANWIRAWLAPMRFQGRSIYLVQAGRPIGGRFESRNANDIVLDENVDEARNLLIQDMMYSGGLEKIGFVTGVGRAPVTQPRHTFDDAHYFTDGLRAVLFFATRPLSLKDVEFLHWVPYLEPSEPGEGQGQGDGRNQPGG
jgi:hypothetical protein